MSQELPTVASTQESSHGFGRRIAALTIAGASLVAACSSNEVSTDVPLGTEAVTTSVETTLPTEDKAVDVDDNSLADGNFACGGKYDKEKNGIVSTEDLSYKFDFFTAGPENLKLSENIKANLVTDPNFGMGQEAFDYIIDNATPNLATIAAVMANEKEVTGDEEFDKMVNLLVARPVVSEQGEVYLNGDCRNTPSDVTMPSPDIPVIRIKQQSSVEGFVLPVDKIEGFMKLVNTYEGGAAMFGITEFLDDKGELIGYHVSAFANGCDNPIRLLPPTPEVPVTTTSQPDTSTPTTPYIPPKNDNGVTPGGGNHGTPGPAGNGPAGQPVNSNGQGNGDVTPVPTQPLVTEVATTLPDDGVEGTAPATTNKPVVIDTSPSTTVQNGTLPPKP